jgi:hypothetical protein
VNQPSPYPSKFIDLFTQTTGTAIDIMNDFVLVEVRAGMRSVREYQYNRIVNSPTTMPGNSLVSNGTTVTSIVIGVLLHGYSDSKEEICEYLAEFKKEEGSTYSWSQTSAFSGYLSGGVGSQVSEYQTWQNYESIEDCIEDFPFLANFFV